MDSKLHLGKRGNFFGKALNIPGVGVHEVMPPAILDRLDGFPAYLFMYFHTDARVCLYDTWHPVTCQNCVLWPPHTRHCFGNDLAMWDHSWILLRGSVIENILAGLHIPAEQPLKVSADPVVMPALNVIFRELVRYVAPDFNILKASLEVLFHSLARDIRHDESRTRTDLLELKMTLVSDLSRNWRLEELAHAASLSPSHFSTVFHKEFGMPPMRFLEQLRLEKAASLLESGGMRISEVATAVGFSDPFYFSKRFKQWSGDSPRTFRRRGHG